MRSINIFKTNKILLLPAMVILLGILFLGAFYINITIPPYAFRNNDLVNIRLYLRATAEKVFSFFGFYLCC